MNDAQTKTMDRPRRACAKQRVEMTIWKACAMNAERRNALNGSGAD
ncbi:hypothetical protein [Diaphorobacter aerolatus]|uniref:Uncharacterized protein n=1 Tax=Diaphorobacter aerolatus TaxID=1288495 RepID=A0A7H0GP12_9BURK|nr:hypothetical protein [Diaphorobacter aerolatus]QNP50028.1 hypothetical protein H9K75_09365 [Diaphorobacter aerolatus]